MRGPPDWVAGLGTLVLGTLVAAAALTACVGATPVAPTSPSVSTARSPTQPSGSSGITSTPAQIPAVPEAQLDERGNVAKSLNESGELLSGTGEVAATVTVHGVRVLTECPGEFSEPPANGVYVVADVSASVTSALGADELLLVGPAMWSVTASDGSVETNLETSAGWTCYATEQLLPATVAPGEDVRGYLVLDARTATGRIAYSPNGGEGWSWPLG